MQPIQLTAYQSDWQKQAIEYQTLLRQQLQANLLKVVTWVVRPCPNY